MAAVKSVPSEIGNVIETILDLCSSRKSVPVTEITNKLTKGKEHFADVVTILEVLRVIEKSPDGQEYIWLGFSRLPIVWGSFRDTKAEDVYSRKGRLLSSNSSTEYVANRLIASLMAATDSLTLDVAALSARSAKKQKTASNTATDAQNGIANDSSSSSSGDSSSDDDASSGDEATDGEEKVSVNAKLQSLGHILSYLGLTVPGEGDPSGHPSLRWTGKVSEEILSRYKPACSAKPPGSQASILVNGSDAPPSCDGNGALPDEAAEDLLAELRALEAETLALQRQHMARQQKISQLERKKRRLLDTLIDYEGLG